jgi:hypothetical protein
MDLLYAKGIEKEGNADNGSYAMAIERIVIGGVVRNGVVVPEEGTKLPEGARVEIGLSFADLSPELKAEMEAWERAGDDAWRMIDDWEKETQS